VKNSDEASAAAPSGSPRRSVRTVHIGGRDIEIETREGALGPAGAGTIGQMDAPTAADPQAEARRSRYIVAAASAPRAPSTAPPVMPWFFSSIFLVIGLTPLVIALFGGFGASGDAFILVGVGLIFAAIGVYFLWRAIQSAWLRRLLRKNGVTADAEVIALVNTHVRINDVEMWVVHYGYQAPGGPRVGNSPSMPYAEATSWSPGDVVRVAYDPSNPSLSMWLGASRKQATQQGS
jgi:hypothetical protein